MIGCKRLMFLFLLFVTIIILLSCSKDNALAINNITYEITQDSLTQITPKKIAKLGILADTHGNNTNTAFFTKKFIEEKVDMIIIAGDISDSFRNNIDDYKETFAVLDAVSSSKLPVLLLPGNHDIKPIYYKAIAELKKRNNNIIDLSKIRTLDLDGIDIISLPGINNPGLTHQDGFIYGEDDFSSMGDKIKQLDDKIILVSHNPPKGITTNSIDVIFDGRNVGDNDITDFIDRNKIPFSISGHIHESGGKAVDGQDNIIHSNTLSDTLYLNPGSAAPWQFVNKTSYDGLAAILEIENNKAKYVILEIWHIK